MEKLARGERSVGGSQLPVPRTLRGPLQLVSAGFQEDSRCFSISLTISSKVLWPNSSSRSLV